MAQIELDLQATGNVSTLVGNESATPTSNATGYVDLFLKNTATVFSPYLFLFIIWLIVLAIILYATRDAFRSDMNRFPTLFKEEEKEAPSGAASDVQDQSQAEKGDDEEHQTEDKSLLIRIKTTPKIPKLSGLLGWDTTVKLPDTVEKVKLTSTEHGFWTMAPPCGHCKAPRSAQKSFTFPIEALGKYSIQFTKGTSPESKEPDWWAAINVQTSWWTRNFWARWLLLIIWLTVGVTIVFNALGQPSLDVVGTLIWPLIVIAILLLFRDQVAGLLRRVTGVEAGGMKVSLEAAVKGAQEGSTNEKTAAVAALGQFGLKGDRSAVETLIERLKNDGEPIVREIAARQLGKIGDSRGVMPLINALLQDYVSLVRKSAAEALGKTAMRHEDKNMPDISDLYRRAVINELVAVVGNSTEEEDVRESAADALAAIGEDSVAQVKSLFKGDDQVSQTFAVNVLKKIAINTEMAEKRRRQALRGTKRYMKETERH